MLIRADSLDDNQVIESDVCIVGGGAAGITLALELAAGGMFVTLLESGFLDFDAATQDLYRGDNVGEPLTVLGGEVGLDEIRLRWLGGTTNHWAGYCRPLQPVDFQRRDHLEVSGWPIDHDDLLPFWARAAEWCRITDSEFAPAVWQERSGMKLPPISNRVVAPVAFQIAFPMPFGEVYRDDLLRSTRLRVILGANVVKLADDGRHVSSAEIRTLGGLKLRARSNAFVVASGGIENARLLLASTDGHPSGLGNNNDLVGRYFTEHLQSYAGFALFEAPLVDLKGFHGEDVEIIRGRHAGSVHGVKYALALTSEHVTSANTTGLEIQFALGHLPDGVPYQPGGDTMAEVGALLSAVAGKSPATAAYVQVLAEQRLNPDSRVTLSSETDPFGMPRTRLDWRHTPQDRAAILSGLRTVAEQVGATGAGRFQIIPGGVHADAADHMIPGEFLSLYRSSPDEFDPLGFPVGVGFHHMCTTRMAADPTEGVVDANCRVHGIDNLWMAGSSVFATGGVATPTFNIVALALRLSDHLASVVPNLPR